MLADIPEAGCDEAGRGCLCAPVFAAAVILPPDFDITGLDDSKKLTAHKREMLRKRIEDGAVAWSVASVSENEIDEINILNASILAMHRALDGLKIRPAHIIVDGNRFKPYGDIPADTVVKGDGKFASIAAASILAKTHRDEFMIRAAQKYPGYGWNENMGYPTKAHLAGIERFGLTPLHRRSFGPCKRFISDFDK